MSFNKEQVSLDILLESIINENLIKIQSFENIKFVINLISNKNNEDVTPLIQAIYKNNINIVKFLINSGADVNKTNKSGWTPLMIGSYLGTEEIVKFLIECKSELNLINCNNETALMIAVYYYNIEIVRLLINNGVDINLEDINNYSALDILLNNHSETKIVIKDEIFNLLIENGAIFLQKENKITLTGLGYSIIKRLGKGGYGTVYLVKNRKDTCYAVKVYKKELKTVRLVINEIQITSSLEINHKNMIKSYGHYEDENYYYLFMRYVPDTMNLENYLGNFSINMKQLKNLMLGIAEVLEYLHSKNIAHQDLKLDNILVDKKCNPILIDFGFSCTFGKGKPLNYNFLEINDLLNSTKNTFNVDEFQEMFKKVNRIIKEKNIDENFNSFLYLVKYNYLSLTQNSLNNQQLRNGLLLLLKMSFNINMLKLSPFERVNLIFDYLNKLGKVEENVLLNGEILSHSSNFNDENNIIITHSDLINWISKHYKIIERYGIFPLNKNKIWNIKLPNTISYEMLFKLFTWIIELFIETNQPLEIYLRTVDLLLLVISFENLKIDRRNLQLLGIVVIYISVYNSEKDIGNCVKSSEITMGSFYFSAPEISDENRNPYLCDIYSFGKILEKITRKNTQNSKLFKNIVEQMTFTDPNLRPSLHKIRNLLMNIN